MADDAAQAAHGAAVHWTILPFDGPWSPHTHRTGDPASGRPDDHVTFASLLQATDGANTERGPDPALSPHLAASVDDDGGWWRRWRRDAAKSQAGFDD